MVFRMINPGKHMYYAGTLTTVSSYCSTIARNERESGVGQMSGLGLLRSPEMIGLL